VSYLPEWLQQAWPIVLVLLPYILWFVFCLFAINWRKAWPVLREGAWVPLVLIVVLMAVIWSQIWPSQVANFWWQFAALGALVGFGLFAGWVQERYSWTPSEVAVEPPSHGHGQEHSHSHAHDHGSHSHGHGAH
jgi:hypothetical protein